MTSLSRPRPFAVGDVVSLKSGGPRMTVIDIRRDHTRTRIACMWFAYRKQQTAFFFADTLKFLVPFDPLAALLPQPPAALPEALILETPAVRQARRALSDRGAGDLEPQGEGGDWWAHETEEGAT